MVFHWSLSNSKFPQVSRIFLRILVDLDNTIVWIIPARPLNFKTSSPFTKHLEIVSSAPITIECTVTFKSYSFFSPLARFKYVSLFSLSLIFALWQQVSSCLQDSSQYPSWS